MATTKNISSTDFDQEEYRFALLYVAEFLEQIQEQPVETYDSIAQEVMQGMQQKRAMQERLAA